MEFPNSFSTWVIALRCIDGTCWRLNILCGAPLSSIGPVWWINSLSNSFPITFLWKSFDEAESLIELFKPSGEVECWAVFSTPRKGVSIICWDSAQGDFAVCTGAGRIGWSVRSMLPTPCDGWCSTVCRCAVYMYGVALFPPPPFSLGVGSVECPWSPDPGHSLSALGGGVVLALFTCPSGETGQLLGYHLRLTAVFWAEPLTSYLRTNCFSTPVLGLSLLVS